MLLFLLPINQRKTNEQGTFICALLIMVQSLLSSCNSERIEIRQLSATDSIETVVNAPTNTLVALAFYKQNGIDSFLVYVKGRSNYYLLSSNQPKKIQQEIILPFKIEGAIYQTTDSLFILNSQKKVIQFYNLKTKRISNFALDSNNFYTNLFLPFRFINDKIYIYAVPFANLSNGTQRNRYFKSKQICECKLYENVVTIKPLKIDFPEKYVTNFYYDMYPISCFSGTDNLLYTYKHTDSIFIYSFINGSVKTITIPKLFSSQTIPFDESKFDDLAYAKRYETESTMNFKLLADEQFIYLFQKPQNSYLSDAGELNTFESTNKRILCYSYSGRLVKMYECDAGIELRNAVVFNNKLYSAKNSNGKTKIYEYKLF